MYKFTIGQYFKLRPNARITWLVFANMDGSCVVAVRTNTEVGRKLSDWLMAGGDKANRPCSLEEVHAAAKEFWPHELETAELA